MPPIHLSLALGDYDINRGLIDGIVAPQGIDLTVLTYSTPPRQWRMDHHTEFDVCEFSMSSYLGLRDRMSRGLPLTMEPATAIPVFPHRRFRHSSIYINTSAGIREPRDLQGRRVGLRNWQTTAGLWARGILQDEYGVDLRQVIWRTSDSEAIEGQTASGYDIQRLPRGSSVTQLLLEGELDALIYPEIPAALLEGDRRIARLFEDYKQREVTYYRKTGAFPIMHTVVIRNAVLAQHPWVARELLIAFRKSKDLAFERMRDPRVVSLAWLRELIDEEQALLGSDPWSYDFQRNRGVIERMIRYSTEQGISERAVTPEALFVPSTIDELPAYQ